MSNHSELNDAGQAERERRKRLHRQDLALSAGLILLVAILVGWFCLTFRNNAGSRLPVSVQVQKPLPGPPIKQ